MSYTKEITLWCDAKDCQEWIQLNDYESKQGKVAEARIHARTQRWTSVGNKDYCRKHSTFVAPIVHDALFDGPTISLEELRKENAP